MKPQERWSSYEGYHEFADERGRDCGGSFEVFWSDGVHDTGEDPEPGWYWWACFPGCLPDGEPCGPFVSSNQAYKDARS